MSWSFQCENGCVPAEAIFKPCLCGERGEVAAQPDDLPARVGGGVADVRAQFDDGLVHLGLDVFLERRPFPSSRICWTCERSSRVSGSTIWNSSSMPRVKRCSLVSS